MTGKYPYELLPPLSDEEYCEEAQAKFPLLQSAKGRLQGGSHAAPQND
jgi:hypothetical protein